MRYLPLLSTSIRKTNWNNSKNFSCPWLFFQICLIPARSLFDETSKKGSNCVITAGLILGSLIQTSDIFVQWTVKTRKKKKEVRQKKRYYAAPAVLLHSSFRDQLCSEGHLWMSAAIKMMILSTTLSALTGLIGIALLFITRVLALSCSSSARINIYSAGFPSQATITVTG